MKLYEVVNGYTGVSYVRCLVIAENNEKALEIGKKRYIERIKDTFGDKESYYKNLVVVLLCENTNEEWSSEVGDE